MAGRKDPPAQRRAEHYGPLIDSAPTGDAALALSVDWLKKELIEMTAGRPADAEKTKRELAGKVRVWAKAMPTYKP